MINFEERYSENLKGDTKEEVPETKEELKESPTESSPEIADQPEESPKEEAGKDKKVKKKEELSEDTKIMVSEVNKADVIGKESVSQRKYSESVGVGFADLTGKSAKENVQEVVESKDRLPEKLQEKLAEANAKHDQKVGPNKISEFEVINQDHWLKPFEHDIRARVNLFKDWMKRFDEHEGGLLELANGYKKFGLNKVKGGIMYREWAPSAKRVCLCGDFNGWNRDSHACNKNQYGVWELFIPDLPNGTPAIKHNTKVKASLVLCDGNHVSFVD